MRRGAVGKAGNCVNIVEVECILEFQAGQFDNSREKLDEMNEIMSSAESNIFEENDALLPLAEHYQKIEFLRLVTECCGAGNTPLLDSMIVHIQQLLSFKEMSVIFQSVFCLPDLIHCFVEYDGSRGIQFGVIIRQILKYQVEFDPVLACVAEGFGYIREAYERHVSVIEWVQFLDELTTLVPDIFNNVEMILANLELTNLQDEHYLHLCYVILTKFLKYDMEDPEQQMMAFQALIHHEHDYMNELLSKPVNDSDDLKLDRIKFVKWLLRRSDLEIREAILNSGFDLRDLLSDDNPHIKKQVFILLQEIIKSDQNTDTLCSKIISPMKLAEKIIMEVEDGGFQAKVAALIFASNMIWKHKKMFTDAIIKNSATIFEIGIDILESDERPMMGGYMMMLSNLLNFVGAFVKYKERIMWELGNTGLGETLERLQDNPELDSDLSEKVTEVNKMIQALMEC